MLVYYRVPGLQLFDSFRIKSDLMLFNAHLT
jgi:hypothetical protein